MGKALTAAFLRQQFQAGRGALPESQVVILLLQTQRKLLRGMSTGSSLSQSQIGSGAKLCTLLPHSHLALAAAPILFLGLSFRKDCFSPSHDLHAPPTSVTRNVALLGRKKKWAAEERDLSKATTVRVLQGVKAAARKEKPVLAAPAAAWSWLSPTLVMRETHTANGCGSPAYSGLPQLLLRGCKRAL